MSRILELREKAGKAYTQARALQTKIEVTEKRAWAEEENVQFNAFMDDHDKHVAEADAIEARERRLASAEELTETEQRQRGMDRGEQRGAETPENRGGRTPVLELRERERASDEYHEAFCQAMRCGAPALTREQRTVVSTLGNDLTGGMFAVSEVFVNQLIENVRDANVMLGLADVVYVDNAEQTLGYPQLDTDVEDFEFGGGETQTAQVSDGPTYKKREFKPNRMKARVFKMSQELLENVPGAEGDLNRLIGLALDRTVEKSTLTGSGAQEPIGVFTASDQGVPTTRDVETANSGVFTADDFIDTQTTLKAAYQPTAQWLLNRLILKQARKLKDGNGVYIWQPGLSGGTPSMILDRPYVLSENAPSTYSGGNYVLTYGAFKNYRIVIALGGMKMQRIVELYTLTNQIGFKVSGLAVDGMAILAEAFARMKLKA